MKNILFSNGGYQYLLQYAIKNNLKKYIHKYLIDEYHRDIIRNCPSHISNIGYNLQNLRGYYGFYNTSGYEYQLIFLKKSLDYKGIMINYKLQQWDPIDESKIIGHELEILENTYNHYML